MHERLVEDKLAKRIRKAAVRIQGVLRKLSMASFTLKIDGSVNTLKVYSSISGKIVNLTVIARGTWMINPDEVVARELLQESVETDPKTKLLLFAAAIAASALSTVSVLAAAVAVAIVFALLSSTLKTVFKVKISGAEADRALNTIKLLQSYDPEFKMRYEEIREFTSKLIETASSIVNSRVKEKTGELRLPGGVYVFKAKANYKAGKVKCILNIMKMKI